MQTTWPDLSKWPRLSHPRLPTVLAPSSSFVGNDGLFLTNNYENHLFTSASQGRASAANGDVQSAFLPAALAFLHRALAIADSRAFTAALIFRFGLWPGLTEILAALAIAILLRTPA